MTPHTRYTNGNEVITFVKIVPVFNGIGIDHYVFKRADGRTLTMPKGEVLRDWKVTNK